MKNSKKNRIKNNFLLALVFAMGCFVSTNTMAQIFNGPDHRFSYQGELIDSGVVANGNYDITVSPFFFSVGGSVQGMVSEHLNVTVTNGLFTLNNVDVIDPVGTDPFDGGSLYLEIAVRLNGGATYTPMTPRQQIHAVPYANNITRKGAVNGQVLTFDGNSWEPTTNITSPWALVDSEINFLNNVAIGLVNPQATLHVQGAPATDMFRVATDDGVAKFWVRSNGGTSIGAQNNPPSNGLLVEGESMFNNVVRIGTTTSTSALSVKGRATGNILTIKNSGGFNRFEVNSNGGVEIGNVFTVPPSRGLLVDGDVKQLGASNGMLKYMVKARCTNSTQTVLNSYNGTPGSGTVSVTAFDIDPGACRIAFPTTIGNIVGFSDRYWSANVITAGNKGVNCIHISGNELDCRVFLTTTGSATEGDFVVLVY